MAHWETAWWESTITSGVPSRDHRFGDYSRYVPDRLEAHPITLDGALARKVAESERSIRQLSEPRAAALAAYRSVPVEV